MKKLLLISTFILFSFSSYGQNLMNVGEMYKFCKPYQNNGFDLNGLSEKAQINSTVCNSVFRTLIDTGLRNCQLTKSLREADKDIKKNTLKLIAGIISNSNADLNSVITSFIVFSENNTNEWSKNLSWFQHKFLSNKFPCKIDN